MSTELKIFWKRPRRAAKLPELNTYPATPIPDNLYPAWLPAPAYKVALNVKLQLVQELNSYPAAAISAPYTAWVAKESIKTSFNVNNKLVPELNVYPRNQPYPSWLAKKENRIRFKINAQNLPELNVFPSFNYYPAWEAKKVVKRLS